MWREPGGPWCTVQNGESLALADGDQLGLDVNDPDGAVFSCQLEAAYSQIPLPRQGQPLYVQAAFDFRAEHEGDLGFRAGDIIEVTQQGELDGWWEGSLNGQIGWFPSSYCSAPYK